jgi:hypothetical protein
MRRLTLSRRLVIAAVVGGGLSGLLSTSWAQTTFSLDGFRTCARADNGNHYCKTASSSNWQRVPQEFFNRFKQAEAEAAAGGASGPTKEMQEVADFLNDLSQYLKGRSADGNPVNLTEVARIAISTKAAVEAQNMTEARNGKRRLEAMFKNDPAFSLFSKRFAEERQQLVNQRISEASLEISKNLSFIDSYVAADILSPHTGDLTKFRDQLAKALKERNLAGLNRANTEFAKFIEAQALTAEYRSVMLAWTERNTPQIVEAPKSTLARELGITERTRFLIDGENEELVLLYNTKSGRVVKSLRGDLVFKSKTAELCFAQDRSNERIKDLERLTMALIQKQELDVQKIHISQAACPIDGMDRFDIMAFQRVGLLSQAPDYVSSMVRGVEAKFALLAALPAAEVARAFQNEVASSAGIEAQILNGKSSGFGLVYTNPAQGRICHTVAEDADAHEVAVLRKSEAVFNLSAREIAFTRLPIDDAFADYQTHKCNAIYASAEDLEGLIRALKRERLDYVVAPIWVEPLEISAILQAEGVEMANLMAKTELQRKSLQEEAAILQQREQDAAAKRENIERALQARNGSAARAAQDRVSSIVDTFISDVKASGDKRGEGVFGLATQNFPKLTRTYKQMMRDRWEIEGKSYSVEDFGDASWNSRVVEAVVVRAELNLLNKPLGRRDKLCVLFGVIIDAEFAYLRDAIEVGCDSGSDDVKRWQVGSGFKSRWKAAAQ